MHEVAARIDPGKSVKELLEESKKNHPSAEGLMDAYKENMEAARQFVIDHEIATIPQGERVRIEPTPNFIRNIIPYAAYLPPGFADDQEGISSSRRQEDATLERWRRRAHLWGIPATALHESTRFTIFSCYRHRTGMLPRKFGSFLHSSLRVGHFIRGADEQLGFIDQPIQKRSARSAALACAHRVGFIPAYQGMSVDERSIFERLDWSLGMPRLMWRYTLSPTQPRYLMVSCRSWRSSRNTSAAIRRLACARCTMQSPTSARRYPA
jgi:hypothetical protein